MPAQIIQTMSFTQIMDIWGPRRSLEDHLNCYGLLTRGHYFSDFAKSHHNLTYQTDEVPSRHGPDFHLLQSQITIDSSDFHQRPSKKCLRGLLTNNNCFSLAPFPCPGSNHCSVSRKKCINVTFNS